MRIHVTLDPDVERLLKDDMKERGISMREALNQAARKALLREKPRGARRFVQKTFPLGASQDFRWDKALFVAAAMEDEELSRKLSIA